MRLLLKAGVVVLPILVVLLSVRACSRGEAERLRAEVREFDPTVEVVWDADGLIVVAPDAEWGDRAGKAVLSFRSALIRDYADLVGTGRDQRMVVVLFSNMDSLHAYFQGRSPMADGPAAHPQGWTDPGRGAIYLPPESGLQTLRHETVHLLMGQARSQSVNHSPWLKEGLAQLFESFDPDATPPRAPGMGEADRAMLRTLLSAGGFDLMRLLEIDEYEEFVGRQVRRNYLEALALTAFLFEGQPREKLAEYIDLERRVTSPMARLRALESLYGIGGDAFRDDFRSYLVEHSPR